MLVGHTYMHICIFFGWLVMQYKVLSTNMMWMALQFNYGSLIIKVAPSYQVEFQILFHFILFGVMTLQSQ